MRLAPRHKAEDVRPRHFELESGSRRIFLAELKRCRAEVDDGEVERPRRGAKACCKGRKQARIGGTGDQPVCAGSTGSKVSEKRRQDSTVGVHAAGST